MEEREVIEWKGREERDENEREIRLREQLQSE